MRVCTPENLQLISKSLTGVDFESKSLLDVGCGSGLSGQSLKKVGFQTFNGVDAAESFM